MAHHHFHLKANWNGGRLGTGAIACGNLNSDISIPKEMGGPGVGTNPDEMLVGAAATCYLITLAAMIENRRLPLVDLSLESEGVVSDEGSLKFETIMHRPKIVLAQGATPEQVEMARAVAVRAEKACMISKALHGNVELSVAATVTVEK